jgi:chaperonin GroEL
MLHAAGARAALVRGIDRMSDLLRRTLQLVDPFEDTGAMIVRHLAWRTFDLLGDGAATAAVRAQSLIHEAMRYVTGGADPVQVCAGIERGLEAAREELRGQSRTIDLPREIADLIAGIVRNSELATRIGEIVDAVGPDGAIQIEEVAAPKRAPPI